MEVCILRTGEFKLGAGVIAAAAFYRPLVMWAENAWDISAPQKLLGVGAVFFALGLVSHLLLTRLGLRPGASGLGIGGGLHVALSWHQLQPHPLLWLGLVLIVSVTAHLILTAQTTRWLSYLTIAILAAAPLAQLVTAHALKSEPYPILQRTPSAPGTATGVVEDVVIIVVDSYPSLTLARSWFSHDTSIVKRDLEAYGFNVETVGWSQHTFTGLAVPALVELRPVVEAGPKGKWGNRGSTYKIVRGDNLVARSLRSAGYHYTHVESGWDGGSCGPVDTCLHDTWLDEAMWELFRPSVASALLTRRYGYHTVGNSLNVVHHLQSQAGMFDDGTRDYVYAHLLLPHSPLVVDENCNISTDDLTEPARSVPSEVPSDEMPDLRAQLTCVDRLIVQIAELAGPDTAMIITGDHGTATRGQLGDPPDVWSDADIAERLGVFLAYRLPETCSGPSTALSTDVVRSIMACSLDMELPERDGSFLIGADDPLLVDEARMERIEDGLRNSRLTAGVAD